MKKTRLTALFLTLAMLAATIPAFAYNASSLVSQKRTYAGNFSDIKGIWCESAAKTCYEAGLMDGKSDGRFAPRDALSNAQIMAVAARFYSLLTKDGATFTRGSGEEWYQPYADYLDSVIAGSASCTGDSCYYVGADALSEMESDPYAPCVRYNFVSLLYSLLPSAGLTAVNSITALPDTGDDGVLAFYNAGILTGSDKYGTFNGYDTLNRGQAASMLARLVDPSQRVKFTPEVLSISNELLGLAPDTTVLTIDGVAISAETYAYMMSSSISSVTADAGSSYYEKYDQYWDAYMADDNYDDFATYLKDKYGIDVSSETAAQWNVPGESGKTPAQTAAEDTLNSLKLYAVTFSHASSYPLTAEQKVLMKSQILSEQSYYYGYTAAFISKMVESELLAENLARKSTPSASEMNSYLAENGYFYGRYICLPYGAYTGYTEAEARTMMQSVRDKAAANLSDPDYFGYLAYKYGYDYGDSAAIRPVYDFSAADQAALKTLSVGSVSAVLQADDSFWVFVKDDPSQDSNTVDTFGYPAAQVQLEKWAADASVTTTSAYDGFKVSVIADRLEKLPTYSLG